MRRVSENVDRAQAARLAWHMARTSSYASRGANGKLAREESRQYTVAPTEKCAQRKLVKVEGTILDGKNEVAYNEAGYRRKDADIDGGLVDMFGREIIWRRDSIGGIVYLGSFVNRSNLEKYVFKLEGKERYHDYDVYRVAFAGKDSWEGEALIERRHDRARNQC